jgi:hypothetical protein
VTEKELRELDAEVHRVVFGPQPRTWDERYAPHYSTSIAAAWKVVAWLTKKFCHFNLHGDAAWRCEVGTVDRHGDEGPRYDSGPQSTAPLAICKVALAAVKGGSP